MSPPTWQASPNGDALPGKSERARSGRWKGIGRTRGSRSSWTLLRGSQEKTDCPALSTCPRNRTEIELGGAANDPGWPLGSARLRSLPSSKSARRGIFDRELHLLQRVPGVECAPKSMNASHRAVYYAGQFCTIA